MSDRVIAWLKARIAGREQFYKVLAVAVAVNIIFIAAYAIACVNIKDITVTVDGRSLQCNTTADAVGELLESWEVKLDKEDVIKPSLDSKLKDGSQVSISLFKVITEVVEVETDFNKKEVYSSELLEGESELSTKGVKGLDKVSYKVSYLGGEEQKREELKRETVKKPVTQVTTKGTAISYNGVRYSKKLIVVSTAYTHTGNRTATGTYPKRGTMAVDRNTIPMGSYGYVPGYGEVHAEDTGGAIVGNRIDLFFNTRSEAINWGRRTVELYLK